MSYRDTASFGKRMEYKIISEMLNQGLDVYMPLVDDHGVDCIVKTPDGIFLEMQIKARSRQAKQAGCFTVDKYEDKSCNFYFIFYSEMVDKIWVFTSKEFVNNSNLNKEGKHSGRRKITLVTGSGRVVNKYTSFIKEDFKFLINKN